MKIKVDVKALKSAFKTFTQVIPSKHEMQILTCMKLDTRGNRLILTGKGSMCERKMVIECQSDEDLSFMVPFDKFNKFSSSLPSDKKITVTLKDKSVQLTCGRVKAKLDMAFGEFPNMKFGALDEIEVDPMELHNAISTVEFASASDSVKREYNSVALCRTESGFDAVAANGVSIIAIKNVDGILPTEDIVIPRSVIGLFKGSLEEDSQIGFDGKVLFVKNSDSESVFSIYDGRYIKYDRVVPKVAPKHELTFDKDAMLDCLKRILTIANDPIRSRCIISAPHDTTDAVIHGRFISGDSSEIDESITIENKSDTNLNVAYNPSLLSQCLSKVPADTISAGVHDGAALPLVLNDNGFTCVLAQVRI